MCSCNGRLDVPLMPLRQGHHVRGVSQGREEYEGICLLTWHVHHDLSDQSRAFCSTPAGEPTTPNSLGVQLVLVPAWGYAKQVYTCSLVHTG